MQCPRWGGIDAYEPYDRVGRDEGRGGEMVVCGTGDWQAAEETRSVTNCDLQTSVAPRLMIRRIFGCVSAKSPFLSIFDIDTSGDLVALLAIPMAGQRCGGNCTLKPREVATG